jgi:hypothetical protein
MSESPAAVLNEICVVLRWSRQTFAHEAGVSTRTVARWGTGDARPSMEAVAHLMAILNARAPELARRFATAFEVPAAFLPPPAPPIERAATGPATVAPLGSPEPRPSAVGRVAEPSRDLVAAELWRAALAADVSPRKLRAALARLLAAAVRHGWSVEQMSNLLGDAGE